jgi:F420-dependent NADP oxidoreductase-like protein
MKIGVLGTGMVGRALAGRPAGLDHDVVIGTRDVEQTLARTDPDAMGNPPYAEWQKGNQAVRLVPFAEAGAHGELIVNATSGAGALAALEAAGASNLSGKCSSTWRTRSTSRTGSRSRRSCRWRTRTASASRSSARSPTPASSRR